MEKKISIIIYILACVAVSLIFTEIENAALSEIIFQLYPALFVIGVDSTTFMIRMIWIIPLLIIVCISFAQMCDYFEKKLIYFVLRSRNYFNSYLYIYKKVLIETGMFTILYYIISIVVSGNYEAFCDFYHFMKMMHFFMVCNLLVQILMILYFVSRKQNVIIYYIIVIILAISSGNNLFSKILLCQNLTSFVFSDIVILLLCNSLTVWSIYIVLKNYSIK